MNTVDTVCADALFGRSSTGVDATGEVGRYLLARRLLEAHSASRTPAGEPWAKRVGGYLPENTDPIENGANLLRNCGNALNTSPGHLVASTER